MKHQLLAQVRIVVSDQAGEVRGRSEYVSSQPCYLVRFKTAQGNMAEDWISEDALQGDSGSAGSALI